MAEVVWSEEALDDLEDIVTYIEQHDPAAATRYDERLRALGESLSILPERGRPAAQDSRELPSVRLYVMRYRVEDAAVRILSIRHGRRRPLA